MVYANYLLVILLIIKYLYQNLPEYCQHKENTKVNLKMKITFKKQESGSSGGNLDKPLRYLGRILEEIFVSEKIEFYVEDIEIVFAYKSDESDNEKYKSWYKKLPVYYRGKNLTRVHLAVSNRQDTLDNVFDQLNLAFEILDKKNRKSESLNLEKIKSILNDLFFKLIKTDLWALYHEYEELNKKEIIQKRIEERLEREEVTVTCNRLIYDLRFHYFFNDIEKLYFYPHNLEVCDNLLERLRKRNFKLPNYTHLCVMVSNNLENALFHAVRGAEWFVYGFSIYENYHEFKTLNENQKRRIVFELLRNGLNDVARIDKLDFDILNSVFKEFQNDEIQNK